jgi:hypothetical protein
VEVRLSGEDGRRRWHRFSAMGLVREGRQHNEALLKDKAEVASSSWLNGKEV